MKPHPERIAKGLWWDRAWSLVGGCSPVSPGCENCWSAREAHMRSKQKNEKIREQYIGLTDENGKWNGKIRFLEKNLDLPLRVKKPQVWAVWNDLFHDDVPDEFIDLVFGTMAICPQHTFLVLTKRPERMRAYLTDHETPFRISKAYDALKVAEEVQRIKEELRPIPGYPGYFVSNLGIVYTSTGSAACPHCGKPVEGSAKKRYCSKQCKQNAEYYRRTGRPEPRFEPTLKPMSPDIGEQEHLRVQLHRDGSGRYGDRHLVHRLVLEAFVRPGRPGEQACHLDGNPLNNALPNLRWGTQEDNWEDRRRHGKFRAYFKLSPEQADEIKSRFAAGETMAALARTFGVSATQIKNIVEGRQWAIETAIEWPLKNCWAGVTAENQARADERIPILLQTPAAMRFVSVEPMLGPVDLENVQFDKWTRMNVLEGCGVTTRSGVMGQMLPNCFSEKLSWVICGGETGPGARPTEIEWIRDLKNQCVVANVPFFLKQMKINGKLVKMPELDGRTWDEFPEVRQ